jgi:putative FmdB family regulatory protein
MPTYQYACTNTECGNEFELVQSFTDPAASECPVCHGPVRKVFSAVGVVFKGSGFYRTDSRAGNGKVSGGSSGHGKAKDSANGKADSSGSSSSSASSSEAGSSGSGANSSSSSTKSSAPTPAA